MKSLDQHNQTSKQAATSQRVERRAHQRQAATLAAEVTDARTGTKVTTRTNDVSAGGCFLDTLSPLPIGAPVRVQLARSGVTFNALGNVIYAQRGLGMGISFFDVSPEDRKILDGWLVREVSDAYQFGSTVREDESPQHDNLNQMILSRLVRILEKREIITHSEAEEILANPQT